MAEEKLTQAQQNILKSFGESLTEDQAKADLIRKSATTGTDINPAELAGVPALRRQFLDSQVQNLSYGSQHMVFYSKLNKMASASTVVEYTTFDRHGETGHAMFDTEIGLSAPTDPEMKRRLVRTKSLSATRSVSLIAQAVDNIAQPVEIYTNDAITNVIKNIEWASFYGDSSLTDDPTGVMGGGDGLEFDGLVRQIESGAPDNVMDARGKDLTPELLNSASLAIAKGYGAPTDVFMPLGVLAKFSSSFMGQSRFMGDHGVMGQNSTSLTAGLNITKWVTTVGTVDLNGSAVMENDKFLDTKFLGGKNAPAEASEVKATIVPNDHGKFVDEDLVSGDIQYKVTVNSDKGESVAVAVPAVLDAINSSISLAIKLPTAYVETPKYVSVYRQDKNTGNFFLLARIGVNKQDVQGVITFIDRNQVIPGTVDVFIGQVDPMVLRLYELIPMMSLPLPTQNKTLAWSVIWNGALALIAPKKFAMIKNVGYTQVAPTR